MFTGIVQEVGEVRTLEWRGADLRLVIGTRTLDPQSLAPGASVCVQGICLTVVKRLSGAFAADASRETLALSTLGALAVGSPVNLEPALRAGDPLGGHFVSGHVDGIGQVADLRPDARSTRVVFEAPLDLARYFARKGSVTVDGVSLTVNDVDGTRFGVNLIPHTQAVTTLGGLAIGTRVNLEIDQVARYVERLLDAPSRAGRT